eukprot:ctg_387.g185
MRIFAPESVSFPDKERETLKLWERLDAFEESNRRAADRPLFTFYDGPPFATGLPHYGHILAGTIKDTVTRFAYQSGYRVPRRFGWDCHGLPVEYEIDQAMNVRSRDDVLRIGLAKYNDACRSIVMRYSAEWEAIVRRIGRWIDFERGYRTMDLSFMESVWWAFSELHRQGLVYRGFRVMPYSTACSTPLSNFEANLNYKDVQDPAVTVSFPIVGDADGAELVAWTTTPWTLPSNVALCVHPELEYVRLCDNTRDGRVLVVAAARIGELFKGGGDGPAAAAKAQARGDYQVLSRTPGTALVGCRYQPMFDYFVRHSGAARLHDAFRVVADTFVTADSGTGIVHLAPAFGEDDFRICTREGIVQRDEAVASATTAALPCPVDDDGRFTEPVTDLAGVYIKDADRELIRRIKAAGRLIKHDTYQHSYPFCWRSDTPLIYRAVPSWFVAVERIRDRLVACNATARWVPASTGEHRFGNWLANARDWNRGRQRGGGDRLYRRAGAARRPPPGHGARPAPPIRGRHSNGEPHATGHLFAARGGGVRLLVRVGRHAVRQPPLPVRRRRAGVPGQRPLSGQLYRRGAGPDTRLVLHADGAERGAVRSRTLPERHCERVGAGRGRQEDEQAPEELSRSDGGGGAVRRRCAAPVPDPVAGGTRRDVALPGGGRAGYGARCATAVV